MIDLIAQLKDEFNTIRSNALVNSNAYDGRYTQKNRKDAYIEFLEQTYLRIERKHREVLEAFLNSQN